MKLELVIHNHVLINLGCSQIGFVSHNKLLGFVTWTIVNHLLDYKSSFPCDGTLKCVHECRLSSDLAIPLSSHEQLNNWNKVICETLSVTSSFPRSPFIKSLTLYN